MIVVDTTILAEWLYNEGGVRDSVLRLQTMEPDWMCLALARYELGNVGWKLFQTGRMEWGHLAMSWEALRVAQIQWVDEVEWLEVSALARARGISFYDAAHVWLAVSRGTRLYTRDAGLRKKCCDEVSGMP